MVEVVVMTYKILAWLLITVGTCHVFFVKMNKGSYLTLYLNLMKIYTLNIKTIIAIYCISAVLSQNLITVFNPVYGRSQHNVGRNLYIILRRNSDSNCNRTLTASIA